MAGRTGSRFRTTKGLDRLSTSIKAATSSYSKALTVGDITSGTVVEVVLDGAASSSAGSATIRSRATGAILLGFSAFPTDFDVDLQWVIEGTTLSVLGPDGSTETVYFWVF